MVRRRSSFVVVVALALLAAATSAAEVPAERVAELARRVGSLLERPLREVPPVEAMTPGEVEQALLADAKARLRALGASEEEAEKAVAAQMIPLALQGSRLTALYLPGSKRIVLQPRVIDALTDAGVIPKEERSRVVELLVAHEIAHAIQDQEIGLIGFLAVTDETDPARRSDRESGRRAVVEGQAMLVQELLARQLVAEDAAWTAAARVAESIAPGALAPEGDPDRYREGLIYRGGARLAKERHAKGGAAATWELFRDPPADLSALTGTTSVFDAALASRLAKAIEADAAAALGAGWSVRSMSASPATALASQLATLPPERREPLIASIRALAALGGGTQAGGRAAFVVVLAADDAAAERLDRELFGMQSKTLEMLGLSTPKSTDADADGLRTVARLDVREAGDGRVPMSFLHGRRGLVVVQITILNDDRDAAALRGFAERAVRAAEGAEAGR